MADITLASRPRSKELGVVARVRQHGHARVVLRSRTQERDAADVDLLDRVRERAVRLCDGRRERVEVAYDDGDRRDVLRGEVG